ncbi:hypothetical protein ACFPOU_17425 [Massilia jejuensis]|uniref:N-acetyltransferase domain-containing protein n=1 Tax=Massilia jejuensis TaxID=648894 RepID=A0ABW0PJT1_9BURK
MELCQANVIPQANAAAVPQVGHAPGAQRTVENLPFTIRRVRNEDELLKAVQIRHAAYARHVPEFARSLALPEDADYESDTVVLLAESKLDGTPLGTARIRTNIHHPLHIEESVALPHWLQGRTLGEVERLGVSQGRIGHVVKVALVKAFFEYFEKSGLEYAVISGRTPVDRQYEQLLFLDVFGKNEMVPLRHIGNIPHRIMAFEIATGEARWRAAGHPLLKFFRHTHHPDIDVGLGSEPLGSILHVPLQARATSSGAAKREPACI